MHLIKAHINVLYRPLSQWSTHGGGIQGVGEGRLYYLDWNEARPDALLKFEKLETQIFVD
jgi:hypothetical protein